MSLKDKLDEEYEQVDAWRPQPGQELIGTIVRINTRESDQGPPYPVVTIRESDGSKLAFHAFHSIPKARLAEDKPLVGDEIAIRYLGEQEGKNFTYHNYRIVVEHHQMSTKDAEDVAATQQAKEDEVPFKWDGCPSYEERRGHASRW